MLHRCSLALAHRGENCSRWIFGRGKRQSQCAFPNPPDTAFIFHLLSRRARIQCVYTAACVTRVYTYGCTMPVAHMRQKRERKRETREDQYGWSCKHTAALPHVRECLALSNSRRGAEKNAWPMQRSEQSAVIAAGDACRTTSIYMYCSF